MEQNLIEPGLKEAAALAMNSYNWTSVRTLLEDTLVKDSVEYTQLQKIDVDDNIIEVACSRGFIELLSVFLNNGFQVDCIVDKSNDISMLHLAAIHGHLSLVKLLLNVGADIDCKECYGKTPLYWSVQKGHLEVVKHLISAGADINTRSKYDGMLLEAALRSNNVTEEMVQVLLDSGCDPNVKGYRRPPLLVAVYYHKIKLAKLLLDTGANVNSMDSDIPLHLAVRCCNISLIQLLLDYGADINITDRYCNTALHLAVKWGNLESVKFLIERGSLIDSVNNDQETPLLLSVRNQLFNIAKLLIKSGADLNLDINHTLLHKVICEGAPVKLFEFLLERGARVTTVYNHRTALQFVIFYTWYSEAWELCIVKLLLIYGSDHYVEDGYGNSVLHWACRMGNVELVEYLIDYGLNVDAKNREGKKPIDIAHESGYVAIVNIIIDYHCNKYTSF